MKKETKKVQPSVIQSVSDIKAALTVQRDVPIMQPIKVKRLGRPPKYSSAMVKKAYDYINNCEDQYYNYQKGFGSTDTFERRVSSKVPTYEGLALFLGLHRDTLKDWREKYPPFSAALEFLFQKQKEMLIRGGINGDYNPMITKLILSANHGMKERVDSTSDDKPIEQNVTINNYKSLSDDELIALARNGKGGAGK